MRNDGLAGGRQRGGRNGGGPEGGRDNAEYPRFPAQRGLDQTLAIVGTSQYGVFTLAQLRDLGLSARAVQDRAAAGRLHRLYHGVYSLVPNELLTANGRLLAAVLACGPGAALSHQSAGALHDLRKSHAQRIHIVVAGRSRRTPPGLFVHRSITLAPTDLTTVHGIPVTTIPRTLLELAGVIGARQLERAIDQAEILQKFDLVALQEQIDRNASRPAAQRLKAILDEHTAGSTVTWSELEERCLKAVRRRGLPEPQINEWVDFGDGELPVRLDFVWREQRVILETDGYNTHKTRDAFEHDRALARRARRARWDLIRATHRDFVRDADEVIDTVLAAMRRP